jgi:hypothetical protein
MTDIVERLRAEAANVLLREVQRVPILRLGDQI